MKKINSKISILFFQIIIFLFFPSKSTKNCNRSNPILKDKECQALFCSKDDFNSTLCTITNEIIQKQWLNNFINIEISTLRYISFASYSNGDMILQSCTLPTSKLRAFLGLKNNGRGFFINRETNESNYYKIIEVNQTDGYVKFEFKSFIIKISGKENNKKEEYLISLSKENSYAEIYDFKNDIIYQRPLYDFANMTSITSYQNMAISLFSNTSDYYYLFGFIGSNIFNKNKFFIQKHIFKSIENFQNDTTKIISIIYKQATNDDATGFSCFQTEKKNIICFFLSNESEYIITVYDLDLKEIENTTLPHTSLKFERTFYKCLHLEGEIGVFSYFENFTGKNPEFFPIIIFKEFYENQTGINIIDYKYKKIIIDKINLLFDPYILLNDLIKINNNKFCFCSTNDGNKDNLYIILINLFGEQHYYKIRYYIIDLIHLYGYSIYMDLRAHNYNNFISLAFSFKNEYIDYCGGKNNGDKSCVTLLVFSYSNSTDNELILDNYLQNNLTQNYIEYNLENETRIENNIFGYIFSGIQIKDLINCEYLFIITSSHKNSILSNYNLTKNESIKFKLNVNCIKYNAFICNLQYTYKISEPNLSEYDNYPNIIDGFNESNPSDFQKEEYLGRLTYFNIILNKNLTSECNNENCTLCEMNNKNDCFEYKNNFNYSGNEENICFPEETNFINSDYIINTINISNNLYSDYIVMYGNVEIIKKEIKENKEQLIDILPDLMNSIEIGKYYEMDGEDFTIIIKPTNTSISSKTHVDFSSCEKILREVNHIDDSRIITFFQLELNDKNSQSLVNQVGYQAYDNNKKILDLSVCNDTNIQIFYLIKSDSSFDISFVSSFKEDNIDILNIKDDFFNNICTSYSDSGYDVILDDRINDIYQNYSLCDEGCTYNESNLELMMITCDCKVKQNLTTNLSDINLTQLDDIKKSSAFEIIKCYNLVFSWKNKSKNVGFIFLTILILLQIPLLVIFFNKDINPIRDFIKKEMIENGYIKDKQNNNNIENDKKKKKKKNNQTKNKEKSNKKSNKDKKYNPPKNRNSNKRKININSKYNIKSNDNSSTNKIMNKDKNKIIFQINNIISGYPEDIIQKKSKIKRQKTKHKKLKIKDKKDKKEKKIISNLPTKGIEEKEKKHNNKKKIN